MYMYDGFRTIANNLNHILKSAVDYIKEDYDFIIIDCPPSLNMMTVNAMTTADTVLVPIQCEYYALEGLSQLIHTINLVPVSYTHLDVYKRQVHRCVDR